MRSSIWPRGAAGVALVLLAAACSESTAPPSFSDPAAFNTELANVEEAFNTQLFSGFAALGVEMGPVASPAADLLRATLPNRTLDQNRPRSVAAARTLRAMIPQFSGPRRGPLIPDLLYGTSYVWDVVTDQYVEETVPSGPTNGVRFYIYAVDPLTDLPAEPLVEVGYADLMDESASPTALALHVRATSSAAVIHLDYTVTVTGGTSSFAATSVGYVRNGLSGAALRRLDFNIAFSAIETSATTGDLSADATFTLNGSSTSLEIHDDVHVGDTDVTFSRDFRFRRQGEVVRVLGTLTIGATTITGQVSVTINDRLFVRVTFVNNQGTRNRDLTTDEEQLVVRVLDATDTIWAAIDAFFYPAYLNS